MPSKTRTKTPKTPKAPKPSKATLAVVESDPVTARDRIARAYGHRTPPASAVVGEWLDASIQAFTDAEKTVASSPDAAVDSINTSDTGATQPDTKPTDTGTNPVSRKDTTMPEAKTLTLTLKGLSKSGKYALYSGLRTVGRYAITDFIDPENPPADLHGDRRLRRSA